jgi:putative nucleotidyltransferase with HDIG domain
MRLSPVAPVLAVVTALATGVVAALSTRATDWHSPAVLALLLVFALVADRFEIRAPSGSQLVGNLPVFVLVAVLFGPAPAGVIGALTALVQRRKVLVLLVGDITIFAVYPVVAGLAARWGEQSLAPRGTVWFPLLVAGTFMLAFTANALLVAAYMRILCGRRLLVEMLATWKPLLSMQLVLGAATAGLAYAYLRLGAAALVFAGLLVVSYSRLQRDLVDAERLRDEAQARSEELAAANERLRRAHYGALRSLVRSIHLHDHMTARHSAAVARHARALARAVGCSEGEQALVHTAGLLHDVGKHIFDDAILKGDTKLNDEQWQVVRRHPEEGARIVRLLEGHEEVAEIIHAHHERIDGRGYPRGLEGEDIPLLSRMISIADTFDVMTARDSYREPMSPADAIAELRRVSGAQLDARLVDVFVRDVLGQQSAPFVHGDDADFEAELELERSVAAPQPEPEAEPPRIERPTPASLGAAA